MIVHAVTDGEYDKTGLPDPLVLTYYFTVRGDRIVQLIIIRNEPTPRGLSIEGHAGQEGLAMPVTISDSLAGRRALVTGGSKGTGAAIAGRLAEAGPP